MNAAPPDARGTADAHLGRHARFGPVAALLIAALVRFHGLGLRSLWTDEGSTWTAATLPLGALVRRCVERDASPPLYYLLTSWMLRLGDDEAHLRLVSVFASLALVWLTYRLARLGLGRGAATFAALATALSPLQVMYAQEARTYTLVAALLVAATYAWARLLTGHRRRSWTLFVAASALGLWTQSIIALGFLSQGTLALSTPEGRRELGRWLGALGLAVAFYLPWAWFGRGVSEHLSSSHWYVPETDAHGVLKVLRAAVLTPLPLVRVPAGSSVPGLDAFMPGLFAWLLVCLPACVALALTLPEVLAPSPRGVLARVGWTGWLVPILAVLAASTQRPLLLVRYFVFVTPFVSVLFALGLSRVRLRPVRLGLAGMLLALSVLGLARYEHDYTKEPWRTVAAHVGVEHGAGPAAVLVPFDVDPFAFYARRLARPVTTFEVGHPAEPFAAHYTPRELDELEAAARANAAAFPEVWVVVRSPNSPVRREVARRTLAVAGEARREVEQERFESVTGGLSVWRFLRDTTATR